MAKRIVLVDPLGDVLFSGMSLARELTPGVGAKTPAEDGDEQDGRSLDEEVDVDVELEPAPPTKRSPTFGSGIYVAARASYRPAPAVVDADVGGFFELEAQSATHSETPAGTNDADADAERGDERAA